MMEIGKRFVEKTKFGNLSKSGRERGLPPPPLELEFDGQNAIKLPYPKGVDVDMGLVELMENRQSVRRYSEKPLTLSELSYLLWCTQGVKSSSPNATKRMVPSAGARHALETFVLANNVEGLEIGLYRFLALEHKLGKVKADANLGDKLVKACLGQVFVKNSAATFIWVAVPDRMTWRYAQRGYRYLYLDAGHVGQNLYLGAESIESGVCVVGAFDDDAVNKLIGVDGKEQFVIYMAAVGKKIK